MVTKGFPGKEQIDDLLGFDDIRHYWRGDGGSMEGDSGGGVLNETPGSLTEGRGVGFALGFCRWPE